jgi:NtrC-family two-component system response regulator AlgB
MHVSVERVVTEKTVDFNILIVDDEPNIRRTLSLFLEQQGYKVISVSNPQDALRESCRLVFDLAFVDLRLGTQSGLELIPKLLSESPWLKIVVITAFASIPTAVEAMRSGAIDYLPKPFTPEQIDLVLKKVMEIRHLEMKVQSLQREINENNPEMEVASANPAMQRVFSLAKQVADTDATVLIYGENGTGKGLLARAIHRWSPRKDHPFSVISCPSLSPELLETELFGHIKGAFTSAVRDNPGRIALSEGGTLFLDEIGAIPASLQPKLLRFIQDREYERVGEGITRKADVRIISATNQDLKTLVQERHFREDLFYRLNVIQITLPPLRERQEDIMLLAEQFLEFFTRKYSRPVAGFSEPVKQALRNYPWAGNIRELRNLVERAVILCQVNHIGIEHLPFVPSEGSTGLRIGDRVSLEMVEEEHIRRILASTQSLQEAADILGIDQATLWRRRKQYHI